MRIKTAKIEEQINQLIFQASFFLEISIKYKNLSDRIICKNDSYTSFITLESYVFGTKCISVLNSLLHEKTYPIENKEISFQKYLRIQYDEEIKNQVKLELVKAIALFLTYKTYRNKFSDHKQADQLHDPVMQGINTFKQESYNDLEEILKILKQIVQNYFTEAIINDYYKTHFEDYKIIFEILEKNTSAITNFIPEY